MNVSLKHVLLLLVIFGLSAMSAMGQADTLLQIPMVEISAKSIRSEDPGSRAKRWTASEINALPVKDLSELLNTEGIYIKSYGPGSLATSSIRGGAAGHTLVLWNGLPIQSPMLGQLDLSLLPLGSFNSVHVTRGGGSGAWGSGAVGGVIELNSGSPSKEVFSFVNQTILGDFGQFRQAIRAKVNSGKLSSRTSFEYREARNDFRYSVSDNLPKREQPNARLRQRLFTQDLSWQFSEQDKISAHIWHQNSFREIPPTNQQERSEANQEDEATRIMLDYSHISDQLKFNTKVAVFDEAILYSDPRMGLEAPTKFRTFLAEASADYSLGESNKFFLGHTQTLTEAEAEEYLGKAEEHRWSVFGMWQGKIRDLRLQVGLRQEVFDGEFVSPLPSIGAEYELLKNWRLKAKVSKNFRLPTLNDRFWVPGGNLDLKAESGWSQEATIENNFDIRKVAIKWSATAYSRKIDNWIMWSPSESLGFWSASNLATVWSRGLELRAGGSFDIARFTINVEGGYDRIRSTNEGQSDVPGMDRGEQLLYTPGQTAFLSVGVNINGLSLSYHHVYTGTVRGSNDRIPEFDTANIRCQYRGKPSGASAMTASFFFDINNLYNADYLVLDRRPMPGINFQAGIRITYTHSNP